MMTLSIGQIAVGYVFVAMVLVLLSWLGTGRSRNLLWATLRMTVQLVATGFVLTWLFDHPHPVLTVAVVVVMVAFAIYTVRSNMSDALSGELFRVLALALAVGTLLPLVVFVGAVFMLSPWYDPRYVIPVAGMLIGNSMTGMTLAAKGLVEGMTSNRAAVEQALILGGTPAVASRPVVTSAFEAALVPTINSMLGMGIVFLPGMMTGQILGGANPSEAIAYQVAIMVGILGAVGLSSVLLVTLGARTFFTPRAQLKPL